LLYFNKLLGSRLALCALGTPGREYNKVYSCQRGIKDIIKNELTVPNSALGLTLPELVALGLGCSSAINLDGGGSSTLWIAGKIINQTVGDEDEGMGESVLRPVSDGIVFKKKMDIED
jgi:hypothetical protein